MFLHWRLLGTWWSQHVLEAQPASRLVFWAASNVVLGMMVPAGLLFLSGRRLREMGMGRPNELGWRFTLVGGLLSVPFGLWLVANAPQAVAEVWRDFLYVAPCAGAVIIAEHFLISGVFAVLMLPGRRLPARAPIAPVGGAPIRRLLRWLGLAQPTDASNEPRVLAWFGLTKPALFGVVASAVLFFTVHVGQDNQWLELVLSFPGGALMAYMTLRCRSIWPGVLAHYALNLIPLGLWLAFR